MALGLSNSSLKIIKALNMAICRSSHSKNQLVLLNIMVLRLIV